MQLELTEQIRTAMDEFAELVESVLSRAEHPNKIAVLVRCVSQALRRRVLEERDEYALRMIRMMIELLVGELGDEKLSNREKAVAMAVWSRCVTNYLEAVDEPMPAEGAAVVEQQRAERRREAH